MADTDRSTPSVEMTEDPLTELSGEHPYWQDLNPDFLEAQNYGQQGPHPEKTARTAYDVKPVHDRLKHVPDEELKQIPIMPEGARLEQGGTYVDLRQHPGREFKATADMTVDSHSWFVPKSEVPYWIWNKLIGVQNPERLDQEP